MAKLNPILAFLSLLTLPMAGAAQSQKPSPPVDYLREVRPILAENCFACHGFDAEKRQAGLRLDTAEGAYRQPPQGQRAIAPGNPDASELIRRVTTTGPLQMPPTSLGKRLKPSQIETLRRWIAQGAPYAPHWAYIKPKRPSSPFPSPQVWGKQLAADWSRNPIDRFVLARMEKTGLKPAPEADRYTLIRRLSLDLIGLPPSVEEVDAFVNDKSPNAYEKVVDRLLASPHYGERQARIWLDLARYADTNGYEKDLPRSIWPYRDWLIHAFNRNLPFDQFTIEQLAGDLLPNATQEQRIATGFHRNTMLNDEGGIDAEEFRVVAVMDRVDTTATVWLGTTLACAQCHIHKYDPFTQQDYYRFYAFFNQTQDNGRDLEPVLKLPTPEQQKRLEALRAEIADLERTLKTRTPALETAQAEWERWAAGDLDEKPSRMEKMLPQAIKDILRTAPETRTDSQKKELADYYLSIAPALQPTRERLANRRMEEMKLDAQVPSTLVLREVEKPRETHLLLRGDFRTPGELVTPEVPALFPSLPADQPRTRLELAKWLVSRENPLTARVTVNRFWEQFFGRGLVSTMEDFGTQGELPTHPELLDWLAVAFAEGIPISRHSGMPEKPASAKSASQHTRTLEQINAARPWDMKALQKLIVTSMTYRQSSRATPEQLRQDPENKWLARGPRFRVEAEMVRDVALAVSGRLNPTLGGPSVMPPQPPGIWENSFSFYDTQERWVEETGPNRYRRGLYTYWRRTAPFPMALTFDTNIRDVCSPKRNRTNTPLQALNTLNDPLFIEAAGGLAQRMMLKSKSDAERASYGFRLCLARPPRPEEQQRLLSLYRKALARYATNSRLAADLVAHAHVEPRSLSVQELAAWIVVANVLLNLDETITKG